MSSDPSLARRTGVSVLPATREKALTNAEQILQYVPALAESRVQGAALVANDFSFRVPSFYAKNVLNGAADDPLLDIVFPSAEELLDGEELWDATPSPYRASDSPFWVQKYEYQGLIRVTTVCSGLCRFCYLKRKNASVKVMSVEDVHTLFDDLEVRGQQLREVILSGGDPLCAPPDVVEAIGRRMTRLHAQRGASSPHITIHTREPVWDPEKLLLRKSLFGALKVLRPKVYMINVLHPREVTKEFADACAALAEAGGSNQRPAMLCQHPIFKGVNDSVEILEELYVKLLQCSPPVLPYYLVHPFYNGTLPKHRLSLEASQEIYRSLIRRPGCLAPRLVVPTPNGKCVVGPNEPIVAEDGVYKITTKDGRSVSLAMS